MTPKQIQQFNQMRRALTTIAKDYSTTAQLRRESKGAWGLDYEEALEMAYENIQLTAKQALKGVKAIDENPVSELPPTS